MQKSASTSGAQSGQVHRAGALGPAHRGYAYQDLVTAYLLVRCLVERNEAVVVDRKVVDDDRFDDIEVKAAGRRVRRQLKSSENTSRTLAFADFDAANSSLRFDRLVRTFTLAGQEAADEYRLCATWQEAASSDGLASLLVRVDACGTFQGYPTQTYSLDSNQVWPEDGLPVFKALQQPTPETGALNRDEVVRFCGRFIVEVALPPASLDLYAPGPLECLLLDVLTEQIGIGRYPNGARRSEDVGALAIHIAMTSRIAGATLDPLAIAQRLELRTDFGRVAQAFPIDTAVLQERLQLRTKLRSGLEQGGVHLVLAGPGAGKSWALTQLSEDLEREGLVVARHYCFLEPSDELVERRVTTDVFFGNLLGELNDAFRARSYTPPQVFAAGISELETCLKKAAEDGNNVVVIVDGLDHIARVVDASTSLNDNETDIVERLATLDLPGRVTLVVGSQPGAHLAPLREAFGDRVTELSVEPWSHQEVESLALKYGVHAAFDAVGLMEPQRRAKIFDLLSMRTEGNPLYARYLSRGLVDGLLAGEILDPMDWIASTPAIMGDIAHYYEYLYELASSQAKAIADILGILDFSVTESDLREIAGPALEDWIPEALQALSPILSRATAQGGVRIFHESFRRFMLQELQRRGRHLAKVLAPVVTWLEARSFFGDAKSFRFTFPVMRRAEREQEILLRVTTSFVRDSVFHGHPYEAIERNLALAADVAAKFLNWPDLIRLAELARALETCFATGTNNWQEYWETYEAIFGAQALAERLLFDGRPTLRRTQGLLACELVDIAGVSAPWKEYLSLPVPEKSDTYLSDFDPFGALREDDELNLAVIRGRLRLGQRLRIVRRVHSALCHPEAEMSSLFLRKLGKLLAEELSPSHVEQIVRRTDFKSPKRYTLPPQFACAMLLGLSDAAIDGGENTAAAMQAVAALRYASTPEEAMMCVECGASPEEARVHARPPSKLDIGLEADSHTVNMSVIREWIASVRLSAGSAHAVEVLSAERCRVEGKGWYRCWLRYVLAIAEAEAAAAGEISYDINAAFAELVADTRPFEGSPRPCDLYSIHPVIEDSLARGLNLVRTREEWHHAIAAISEARSGTATRLDREDGGPITASAFFSILLPHASVPMTSELVAETLESELLNEEANGTYYSNHAEFRMRLARLHALAMHEERARGHWREASAFLLGYGFHKDIALFDVIESSPALLGHGEEAALLAIMKLQPLLGAVLSHTDRRETKNAPNAWFRSLMEINAVRAIELLCRSFNRERGAVSWMNEQAQQNILHHLRELADPMLLDALWETLLTDIEFENDGTQVAEERLFPLGKLVKTHPRYARDRFVRLCSQISNDTQRYRASAMDRLQSFAQQHAIPMPWSSEEVSQSDTKAKHGSDVSAEKVSTLQLDPRSMFPNSHRFIDILAAIRRLSGGNIPKDEVNVRLTLPLSYAISELVESGQDAQAHRLVYFFVHETSFWSFENSHPVGNLAEYLDNAGQVRLAALAHTLAYTSSRGGRGWLNFGDRTQAASLRRALTLDEDIALQSLADETARKVRFGGFNGITRHLVEQITDWGDAELAARAWNEGFAVIASRLPLPGRRTFFEPFDPQDVIEWSLDEAMATLLLARVSNAALPRKLAALSGFARILGERPCLFQKPIEWLLTRDTSVSTAQAVMQVLLETPQDLTELLRSLEAVLLGYAVGDAWSLAILARKLLQRAGRPVPPIRSRQTFLDTVPSHRAMMLTRFGDVGQVLEKLQQIWPDLPAIVASRTGRPAVDNEVFKHYTRERMELEVGRRQDTKPNAPVLSWPTEMFVAILDQSLLGLTEYLWRQGEWDEEVDDDVLDAVLPDIQLHLALDASRIPRPNLPLPSEVHDQLTEIVLIPDDDPTYAGWIRLALHEQQFYRSDNRDYDPPDRTAIRAAAVVRTAMDGTVPAGATPIRPGDVESWWSDLDALEASIAAQSPQLIQRARVADWLGQNLALVPPPALRSRAKLRSSGFGGRLCWYDSAGDAAVVLRTWRVRGNSRDTEGFTIFGADLLMRPELLDTLLTTHGGPLKELQTVQIVALNNLASASEK